MARRAGRVDVIIAVDGTLGGEFVRLGDSAIWAIADGPSKLARGITVA
jgi:hypothetical protein